MDTAIKNGMQTGFIFGLAQLLLFSTSGIIFYLGAVFGREYNLPMSHVLTTVYIFIFSGVLGGNKIMFMPDYKPIVHSSLKMFDLLDSTDEDQLQVQDASKMLKTPIKGDIQFKGVKFAY